ncbi:MAG TPA: S1/P1 nuclease [Flavobacteriaceae bacterium]|nr:S1/P1 nuclease [Flavobacteriaceae bacterium]
MRRILFLLIVFFISFFSAYAWGPTGHRVTGEIAEKHLTTKAKKKIDELLNGDSLALVSTFADEIKSDRSYRKYSPWHYVNIPFGKTYEEHPKSKNGDIVYGIKKSIKVLEDPDASQTDKVFYLKMLIHLIGDLHQPLHVGIADDKGGNDFQVRWFNKGTNLHRVWDSQMIESYQMNYSELTSNAKRLTKSEKKAIQSGGYMDWLYESRALMEDIYNNTDIGDKLGYDYMYLYMDTVRSQLQKGGLRLAVLLNDIFG